MLHYIIQTVAFQLFFLIIYDVFLKKETFFNWNRAYLLVTAALSFIIPFIKISSFKTVISQDYIIKLPEVFIGEPVETAMNSVAIESSVVLEKSFWSWELVLYWGIGVAFILFIYKLIKLLQLLYKNPKERIENILIVNLLKSDIAFSFFNYIFLGEHLKKEQRKAVLKHELVHVKQRHTLDLLFFELLRILFWFNPLVYIYQSKILLLHEFIADEQAVKTQDKSQYYQSLLSQVFETKNISFINPFFKQSLIKKRIIMLQKSKSKQIKLIKYALLIPLVFGMLIYTSCNNDSEEVNLKKELSGSELKNKLLGEFNALKNSGTGMIDIYKDYLPKSKNYILTKEEYFKQNIFYEYLYSEYGKKNNQSVKHELKTYDEYLKWKKTDEAKEIWENNTYDGVLKLVVEDMNSLTSKEQKKRDKKMQLLHKDDFFTKLIQTDGEMVITLGTTESKKTNERPNSSFANTLDVPFAVIDQVPLYPGCEDSNQQKKCMSENISKHINRNFNTKLANEFELTGRQRINVIFKIDTNGEIIDVRARAPHPALEEEAIRVVKTLPKMIPGKHNGNKVNVPYSLPIIFEVNENTQNNELEIAFALIENAPIYPGCETGSKADKKKCTSEKINEFIIQNFNTKIANQNKLIGNQKIRVIFHIDTNGNTKAIRARAAHPALEEEAIRVVKTLPKMIPGKHNGKVANVAYSLPIIFQVAD